MANEKNPPKNTDAAPPAADPAPAPAAAAAPAPSLLDALPPLDADPEEDLRGRFGLECLQAMVKDPRVADSADARVLVEAVAHRINTGVVELDAANVAPHLDVNGWGRVLERAARLPAIVGADGTVDNKRLDGFLRAQFAQIHKAAQLAAL